VRKKAGAGRRRHKLSRLLSFGAAAQHAAMEGTTRARCA
jgi:hypothetical protein